MTSNPQAQLLKSYGEQIPSKYGGTEFSLPSAQTTPFKISSIFWFETVSAK